jgi:hypothetical protein
MIKRNTIPSFAADYPARAVTLEQLSLPFYCINCQRKKETIYLTPDFGPFCDDCLQEVQSLVFAAMRVAGKEGSAALEIAIGKTKVD